MPDESLLVRAIKHLINYRSIITKIVLNMHPNGGLTLAKCADRAAKKTQERMGMKRVGGTPGKLKL